MKMIKVAGWSKDGNIEFTGIELPSKRIVCPTCDGKGSHVNPNVDGHGLSAEDFQQDEEFAENYFSGVYDVRCEECRGERVLDAIDEERCRERLSWMKGLARYHNGLDLDRADRLEADYERRIGA